jgi:hypothetical protein
MPDEWYYGRGAEIYGPFSGWDVAELADAGAVLATDAVWQDGDEGGVPAGTVPHLFPGAAPVPAAEPKPSAPPPRRDRGDDRRAGRHHRPVPHEVHRVRAGGPEQQHPDHRPWDASRPLFLPEVPQAPDGRDPLPVVLAVRAVPADGRVAVGAASPPPPSGQMTPLIAADPSALERDRDLFRQDVLHRSGVTRSEADDVIDVLDRLIAWNPERLVHLPDDRAGAKTGAVVRFGLASGGPVFWAARPCAGAGARLVVLAKRCDAPDDIRADLLAGFRGLDRGGRGRAAGEAVPALDFRVLRFAPYFDRATRLMADALAAM